MVATPLRATDAGDLVARAEALQPTLRERAPRCAELRRVPDETIADFQEAGFFRMLQPKRWGGLEVDPETFFEVQMAVAAACPSSAWVLGVVAVHSWQLALFDDQAQQDVWSDDRSTLISSSYAPVGKVTRADGGFRISGRWSFSSGSDHCGWVFLGGFAPVDEGSRPDMRTFLIPKADYTIEDTWFVSGLAGTGSKDIVVDDAFVPEHRTHKFSHGFACQSPGNEVNTAPLYNIPFGQIFVRSVSTPSIGMAMGALTAYREITAQRIASADGAKVAADPANQEVAARASATIDDCRRGLLGSFTEMMAHARAGEPIPLEARVKWRYASAATVSRCVEVVDELFTRCGGRAIFLANPINRFFQDVHACRAHFANNPDKPGRNLGSVLLGNRTTDFFL